MNSKNRDILLLTRNSNADKQEVAYEVEKLHQLLFHVESMYNFCIANEIIDITNYKIIDNPIKIERIIKNNKLKKFQFISNKN